MFSQNSFFLLNPVSHHRITPKVDIAERDLCKTICHYPGIAMLFLVLVATHLQRQTIQFSLSFTHSILETPSLFWSAVQVLAPRETHYITPWQN